jgi:hypothetical protein
MLAIFAAVVLPSLCGRQQQRFPLAGRHIRCHRIMMAVDEKENGGSRARAAGRPRRLTLDQIIAAAREIGLGRLTMSAVAKRLDVGITVLYGYISGRGELIRLVAAEVTSDSAAVRDQGQSWPVYVAQSAAALYQVLTGPGKLLAYYIDGGLGPEVEIDRTEAWLSKLTGCGFSASDALLLQRRMGEIVIGGAVTALHSRALEDARRPFEEAARAAIAARGSTLPLLAGQTGQFAERRPVWTASIAGLLAEQARERNEEFDKDAVAAALSIAP